MRILIRNGTIITSESWYPKSGYLITDSRINNIEAGMSTGHPDKTVDATGCYILPGGVDPHVHMHLPTTAGYSSDDFHTGSKAALFGGTTTLLDFVTPKRGESLVHALMQRKEEAKNSMVDFSFHVTPVEWRDTTEKEVNECIQEGVTSFKVYMAYQNSIGINDIDFRKVLDVVRRAGGIVTVHCELDKEIEALRNKYFDEDHSGVEYHPLSRPAYLEAVAVKQAIDLAGQAGCPLYIVHISAKESIIHIRDAQFNGQRVFAETCPQYLLLDESKYRGDFTHTAPYVITPPLRGNEDNEALWEAISLGIINIAGTDHCPFNLAQKKAGLFDFRKIPGGAGGVEHRLELLYTYGVLGKRITINRMVDLFSTQAAKIFGLYPAKGDILTGSDADLVIWNPDHHNTISAKSHHQNCDINIYEGFKTQGIAECVIAGGRIVIENRELVNQDIKGQFLRR